MIHILTGSFLPLAAGISDHLGWGQSIGTEVEIRSGRLTGKLSTPAIKGYQKVKSIKRVFKIKDQHFRFFAAAGDSYSDRYLLEKCALRYFPRNTSRRLIRYFAATWLVLLIFYGGKASESKEQPPSASLAQRIPFVPHPIASYHVVQFKSSLCLNDHFWLDQ